MSSFLGVSATAVSGATFAANRRKLLASVGVYYVVSVNSGISSDGLISLLQKAVADGRFLAALKANSGISITGISSLVILGFTPTSFPSKAPVSTTLLGMFEALFVLVRYCIVLYCIGLYCIVLYCIALHCIVLYCIVLYCIVLYCIVL